jgi:hypothetical protein
MTPADLDRLELLYTASLTSGDYHVISRHKESLAQLAYQHAPELIRLARRGLRAERETCGTCHHWADNYCDNWDGHTGNGYYCADWREWEES